MGDVINMRQARKAMSRATADAQAAENRRKFGCPKAERDAEAARERLARRRLEGHRLTGDADE
jgi:hypothetical protein